MVWLLLLGIDMFVDAVECVHFMFSISGNSRFDAWTLIADVATGLLASALVYVLGFFTGGMLSFVPWMFFALLLFFFAGMARGQTDDCNLWLQAAHINLVWPLFMLTWTNGSGGVHCGCSILCASVVRNGCWCCHPSRNVAALGTRPAITMTVPPAASPWQTLRYKRSRHSRRHPDSTI